MNINEEKAHVYALMRDIAAERRMLTDTYYALQERLHKLNDLEEIGLPTLNLKGYADLFNETNKRLAASNIAREETVAAPAEIAAAVRQEVEAYPATPEPEPVAAPAVSIPFEEMDHMKRIDNAGKVKPARKEHAPRRSRMSMKKARETIANILTSISTPVTSSELYRLFLAGSGLDEEEMTIRNFRSNVLYRAMEADPRIVAVDVEGTRSKTYEYVGK